MSATSSSLKPPARSVAKDATGIEPGRPSRIGKAI